MKFSTVLSVALASAPGLLASAVPASEGELFARTCWWGSHSGCSNKWCWKICDPNEGTWCWTADDKSSCTGCGDWFACSSDSDCNTDMACGADDPHTPEPCDDCGCACWD